MEVKIFAFLQIAVLIAFSLHLASAGSKELSGPESSENSIEAAFCDTNCTEGTDGVWSGCSAGCFCVHVGNSTVGRCMTFNGVD
uniref:Evasin P1090 n=1 Tax=Ixodes ricinus TaxID=34613 RepID=E1090_IXORI|nr:RecName: Full=Evasin P1090; Flags: Precursor [Ixodes ricinus]